MKKIKYLSIIAGLLLVFTACESNDPQAFQAADSNASFPTSTVSINETATTPIEIPLALAGIKGSGPVTVTLTASSEGANPAVEGTDFVIENKEIVFADGCGVENVRVRAIDNDIFTGRRVFTITISATSPELLESKQNSVQVSIIDDEHPWAALIGTYKVNAISYFDGTQIDFDAIISASDEDVNVLNVDFGYGSAMKMSVADVDGEIIVTIKDNQYIGPIPKPTNAWNPYFRAFDYDTDDFMSEVTGVFENDVIESEKGFGVEAIHPTTGASGGFMELTENGFTLTKVE